MLQSRKCFEPSNITAVPLKPCQGQVQKDRKNQNSLTYLARVKPKKESNPCLTLYPHAQKHGELGMLNHAAIVVVRQSFIAIQDTSTKHTTSYPAK